MSTNRMIFRLAAATAVGVVLAGAVAAPAFAEDVIGVSLNSVPSSFTVGSRADTFSVTLRNNRDVLVFGVNVSFVIRLNGLTASQVHIRGTSGDISLSDSGGLIVGTDPRSLDFLPKQRGRDVAYSIEFLSGAPSGRATFTVNATRSGNIQGSASSAITVKGGGVAQSPTPSASATDPASPDTGSLVPPTGPGGEAGPLANNNQIPVDSGGIPVALYVMGAILVGVGGVILWMLFRQRPQAAAPTGFPTGDFDAPPPNLGYPVGRASTGSSGPGSSGPGPSAANLLPTAPLPAVRNPGVGNRDQSLNPPPPVDPWATRGGGGRSRHGAD